MRGCIPSIYGCLVLDEPACILLNGLAAYARARHTSASNKQNFSPSRDDCDDSWRARPCVASFESHVSAQEVHTRYRLIKTRCCTVMPRLARPQKQRAAAEPRQLPHRRLPFAAIQLRGALDQLQHGGLGQLVPQRARQLGEELRRHLPALLQPRGGPDRSRLTSVESFFRYTEEEGARVGGGETLLLWSDDWTPSTALLTPCFACLRSTAGKRFFEELDRDGDGRVRLEDLKLCMRCVASSPQLL